MAGSSARSLPDPPPTLGPRPPRRWPHLTRPAGLRDALDSKRIRYGTVRTDPADPSPHREATTRIRVRCRTTSRCGDPRSPTPASRQYPVRVVYPPSSAVRMPVPAGRRRAWGRDLSRVRPAGALRPASTRRQVPRTSRLDTSPCVRRPHPAGQYRPSVLEHHARTWRTIWGQAGSQLSRCSARRAERRSASHGMYAPRASHLSG
jgi:hypothetical protein